MSNYVKYLHLGGPCHGQYVEVKRWVDEHTEGATNVTGFKYVRMQFAMFGENLSSADVGFAIFVPADMVQSIEDPTFCALLDSALGS